MNCIASAWKWSGMLVQYYPPSFASIETRRLTLEAFRLSNNTTHSAELVGCVVGARSALAPTITPRARTLFSLGWHRREFQPMALCGETKIRNVLYRFGHPTKKDIFE